MNLTDMVIMPGDHYQDACNAIREKTGGTNLIRSGEMGAQIRSITTGVELPELTNPASASDIASGKEAIDGEGNVLTGTAESAADIKYKIFGRSDGADVGFVAVDDSGNMSVTFALDETPSEIVSVTGYLLGVSNGGVSMTIAMAHPSGVIDDTGGTVFWASGEADYLTLYSCATDVEISGDTVILHIYSVDTSYPYPIRLAGNTVKVRARINYTV